MRKPLILCPLQIEANAARKALGDRCDIIRTGPGPRALTNALSTLHAPPGAVVILFGAAGGLGPSGLACIASRVTDQHGSTWTPAAIQRPGVTVAGVDSPLCNALEKQALARRTDAAIVDCESHVFAPFATERAWKWGVVRGVTDDHRTDLSPAIISWVAPNGRTRPIRIAATMLRDPRLIPEALRLGRRTSRALRAASLLLKHVVDELSNPDAPDVSAEQ